MNKFLKNIKRTISSYSLIKPGDTILIGVSGGADSIALLEILEKLRHELGLKLIVFHFNHGLRKSADTDQRFVEKICRQKNIACRRGRNLNPRPQGDSIEQAARKKRFAALIKCAKQVKADSIALAHHQNDLAETVLMRIIRGSGLQGLQAILPKRTIEGMTFIRPLIHEKRSNIEAFLKSENIKFRTDPTNKNTKFLRNKIRHKLLNCLSTNYNPNIQETLANLAETVSLDYEFLRQESAKHFKTVISKKTSTAIFLNLKKLCTKHPAIQRMIIRMAIEHIKGDTRTITLAHIRSIETFLANNQPKSAQIHLPMKITVEKVNSNIEIRSKNKIQTP